MFIHVQLTSQISGRAPAAVKAICDTQLGRGIEGLMED
jgi:hypothetical protein